ncbi:dipeptide transport system permease protein DppC [Paenibacillus pini JCM 16418]|uniref:Dipeptide transport system permease protein DppC n=1 Tax=Paenibacillus pini JCM 16418 TaxID=1236976 RepID=W7YG77_9BACL|nr:dipeptide transport system permease protein DppC [Paenibacillus pini JCM 16418]
MIPIPQKLPLNTKQWALMKVLLSVSVIILVILGGSFLDEGKIVTNLTNRNSPPSIDNLFGTDWLGRDMFTRTFMGLTLSIGVGLIGAIGSASIALILGIAAATMGRTADRLISWFIDLFLSVPHLVTLILIAFTLGGGFKGIVIGLALTHWPTLLDSSGQK